MAMLANLIHSFFYSFSERI